MTHTPDPGAMPELKPCPFNRKKVAEVWKQKAEEAIRMGRVLSADEELDIILEAAWNTRADLASAGEPGLEELLAMVPEGWHWVLRGGHPDDAPGECTFLMDNSENEAEYKRGHGPTPTATIKNAMGVENG